MNFEILYLIFGMAFVTFLPRFLPMALFARQILPYKVKMGLEFIPISILSAIVFPILFFNEGGTVGIRTHYILSAIPVFIFAWGVRSLWGSVLLGMWVFWGLGFFL